MLNFMKEFESVDFLSFSFSLFLQQTDLKKVNSKLTKAQENHSEEISKMNQLKDAELTESKSKLDQTLAKLEELVKQYEEAKKTITDITADRDNLKV